MEKFESEINRACKWYETQGLAIVHKIEVPQGRTKTGIVFRAKTPFDYCGVLKDGRFVGFEVKAHNQDRLAVGSKSSGLVEHQWFALQDYEKLGAVTFLLWKRDSEVVRLRVEDIKRCLGWDTEKSRKSIRWDRALFVGKKIEKENGIWKFLDRIV